MDGITNKVVDLQVILDALLPVRSNRKFELATGEIAVVMTSAEYEAATNVIAMIQLADLVNYKKAQDSYPRLLQAVKLVKAIVDHPEANPTEQISLSPKTRAQLDSALKFAEK